MARLMREDGFRRQQELRTFDPHVSAVNKFVDSLRDRDGRCWVPYVAPMHGGINSRLLFILRDPGPATQIGVGSGFLCIENDDPSAERQARAFEAAGIDPGDALPWNIYPWYINKKPTAVQRMAGVTVLVELISLLQHLEVVLLQGGDAQDGWKLLEVAHPSLVADRGLHVERTFHPSPQALFHPDPAVRQARSRDREETLARVASKLAGPGGV